LSSAAGETFYRRIECGTIILAGGGGIRRKSQIPQRDSKRLGVDRDFSGVCVVADAVAIEPVSASDFP
jgi:hypothetical protein